MNILLVVLLIILPGAAIFLVAISFNAFHQMLKKRDASKRVNGSERLPYTKSEQDIYKSDFERDFMGSLNEEKYLEFSYSAYSSVSLMTKHEMTNYKTLYWAANSLNLKVFTKVRLLDLIDVNKNCIIDERSQEIFRRLIWAKHVDFVVWEPQESRVLCIIELDDKSHDGYKRKIRDRFVEKVLVEAGYTYLHYLTFYETAMYYKLKNLLSIAY